MTPTDKVLGSIAAIQTLIENFPMSILDNIHGKTYTSLFDFMVDVLNACGVNTNDILDYLLNQIFGLEVKVEGGIQGLYDQVTSKAIEIDEQNDFLQKLEMGIKKILQALLMSVFTCSAIPIIPNKMFDGDDLNGLMDDATGNLIKRHAFDRFIVPTKAIDILGMLNLCPTSSDGSLYYAIEGGDKYYHKVQVPITTYEVTETVAHTTYEYQYQECSLEEASEGGNICRVNFVPTEDINDDDCDYIVYYDGLNPNTLYKTMDMNAFIWYVLNKGMTYPQIEYNHMMWDSRVSAAKIGVGRTNAQDWNDWYNTKENENDEFLYDPFKEYGMPSYITDKDPLYPIIQLEPWGTSGQYLAVYIPSQRYFRPRKREALITNMGGEESVKVPKHAFNASIYKFNWDYLTGIQILHPKILIVGMCEHLLGFALSTVSSLNFNFTRKLIKSKISKAIKNIVEANDMEVADCYMSFSNDEFNDMLQEMLMARYGATNYGGETTPAKSHDLTSYISNLDGVNSSSSAEGNVTQIKKLITEVTADPTTEPTIEYGLQVDTDGNLLQKLLWALAMPIIEAIFTPQVVLLLLINFELMGVTKMDDFLGEDYGKILNLLLNKLLGLTKAIVLFIKDKIIELLFKLFYEKVLPILIKYKLLLVLEALEYWLMILKAAVECLPLYKFRRKKIIGQIDDVDYADIINDQTTPESTTDSC